MVHVPYWDDWNTARLVAGMQGENAGAPRLWRPRDPFRARDVRRRLAALGARRRAGDPVPLPGEDGAPRFRTTRAAAAQTFTIELYYPLGRAVQQDSVEVAVYRPR
jgi:hypothetical protein